MDDTSRTLSAGRTQAQRHVRNTIELSTENNCHNGFALLTPLKQEVKWQRKSLTKSQIGYFPVVNHVERALNALTYRKKLILLQLLNFQPCRFK